jgi:uncharacterized protein YlxW (UPF0749 family)
VKKTEIPKIISLRSLLAVLSIGFGILISAQLRSIPDRISNPVAPYSSLQQTKDELYKEQDQLKTEIKSLQISLDRAQSQTGNLVLSRDEIKNLSQKKALAGLTKLNGSGVIIRLDDSKNTNVTDETIVHAADIRDIITLLWASGAEGIAINNQRVVINTAIDCIVNTVLINNVRVATPFQIEAVGDQKKMYEEISSHAFLSDLRQRKANQGIIFDLSKNGDITLPIYDGSYEINTNQG